MPRKLCFILVSAALVSLAGCDLEDAVRATQLTEDFHHTYALKPGGRLSIENFNGSVEILGWDRDQVEINGTKYASTQDLLDSIKIDIVQSADSIQVRTMAPRENFRGNRGAKYRIQVPRKTRLERVESSNGALRLEGVEGPVWLRSSNGGIRLIRVQGDVDARTSNGGITLEEFSGGATLETSNGAITAAGVRGYLSAQTSNGPVDAVVDEMDLSRPLKLRSSNGPLRLTVAGRRLSDITAVTSNAGITVRLPQMVDAKLKANTSNSRVTTDFTLSGLVAKGKSSLEGSIGGGGPLVQLSTSNGGIRVEKN